MTNTANADFVLAVRSARKELARLRKWEADYNAEVVDWYANGPGRPAEWVEAGTQDWFVGVEHDDPSRMVNIGGRGHTFPHCIHGSSRWTDYDNICGPCEDGDSLTYLAACEGARRVREFNALMDWARKMPSTLPKELHAANWKWVAERVGKMF